MKITDLLAQHNGTAFSFEVLPPLKGNGIGGLKRTIDRLRNFNPQYINITTHRSEYVYKDLGDGLMQRSRVRRRPGTIAVRPPSRMNTTSPLSRTSFVRVSRGQRRNTFCSTSSFSA